VPGKAITEQQVKLYMRTRQEGATQVLAAAKAGLSERSARRIERGGAGAAKDRDWRTRNDAFASVWDSELAVQLEQHPGLSASTLLEALQSRYPGQHPDSMKRTLQRRVKQWRALRGPAKPVMFRQQHAPGALGLSDFTQLKRVQVQVGGESFTALAEGLQEALWRLGGAPDEHRTDSLSAAYRNLDRDARRDATASYEALCTHYGMRESRNNRGLGHENGAIESPQGHLKWRIEQALMLRGHTEFESVPAYQRWLDQTVCARHNARLGEALEVERKHLRRLPLRRARDWSEVLVRVTSSSTISVRCVLYTVPSRLIGERLRVRLYDDRLVGYVGTHKAVSLPRVYPLRGKRRARYVDYRHVVESLVKKPRAFRSSVIRDALLPTGAYRRAWMHFDAHLDAESACKHIVTVLAIAARHDCERSLGLYLDERIAAGATPSLLEIERRFGPARNPAPSLNVQQHHLGGYDTLLSQTAEELAYA
jgi:hypothetical protein